MQLLIRTFVAIALLLALGWLCCLPFACARRTRVVPNSYRGDGRFVDAGANSFPRYRIVFRTIKLDSSANERFRMEGLPSMSATLVMLLEGESVSSVETLADREAEIKKSLVQMRCRVRDHDGAVLADTEAGNLDWIVSASVSSTRLWHASLREIKVNSGSAYIIDLEIKVPADVPNDLSITPILQGGGRERL